MFGCCGYYAFKDVIQENVVTFVYVKDHPLVHHLAIGTSYVVYMCYELLLTSKTMFYFRFRLKVFYYWEDVELFSRGKACTLTWES